MKARSEKPSESKDFESRWLDFLGIFGANLTDLGVQQRFLGNIVANLTDLGDQRRFVPDLIGNRSGSADSQTSETVLEKYTVPIS